MTYIICYDIAEQKIRTKVAKYLESVAHRLQCSVFTCESSEAAMHLIKQQLLQLTHQADGPLLLIAPMCSTCTAKLWRVGRPMDRKYDYIIA